MDNETNSVDISTIEQTKDPPARKPSFLQPKIFITVGVIAVIVIGAVFLFRTQEEQPVPKVVKEPITIGTIQWLTVLDQVYEGLKDGMTELGYVEGEDVVYLYGNANADPQEATKIGEQYVEQNVDIIFGIAFPGLKSGYDATVAADRTDIPVVFAHADSPVRTGIVESFKSSGNHTTGIAVNIDELTEKKLEFLQRIDPSVKKIGIFVAENTVPAGVFTLQSLKENASRFGMEVVEWNLTAKPGPPLTAEIQKVADTIQVGEVDAIFHPPGTVAARANWPIVTGLGNRLQIPTVWVSPASLQLSGTLSYSHKHYPIGKQAAVMIDKILNGTAPSDIPIEFPEENFLALNLDNANELGLTIPDSILELAEIKVTK